MKNSNIITTELEQERAYAKIAAHNALPTVVNNPINGLRTFYISHGRKSRMFTLWREPVIINGSVNPFAKEQFYCNLSTNLEKAVDKVLSMIGNAAYVYIDQDSIYEKGDNFKFESGKHAGKLISDVVTEDPEFILWMCKTIYKNSVNGMRCSKKQNYILSFQDEATALVAELDAKKPEIGKHLGEVKSKLITEVVFHSHKDWGKSFDKQVFNSTFKDSEGNTIIYIGSVDLSAMGEVGKTYQLECVVKSHDKWKNYLQTKINRPVLTNL